MPSPPTVDATPEDGARAEPPSRLSAWVGLAAFIAFVALVAAVPDLAALVVVAAVLSYLLLPVVNGLERRGWSRRAAAIGVMSVLVVVASTATFLAAPLLMEQALALGERWQSGQLLDLLAELERAVAARVSFLDPDQVGLVRAVREATAIETGPLAGYVPGVLNTIGNAVVVPFVMYGLLKDGPDLRRRALALVPNRAFEFAMSVAYKADASLGGYLRGQAAIALLVGLSTALVLGIIGVEYYLVLGAVTGLANFVPYVGFVVSAALSLTVSVVTTGGFDQALWVAAAYIVLQSIENVVFQPWITGRNVSMHPAMVLLAILIGGRLWGVLGMTLAVPTAAILQVLLVETVVNLRRYHL